MREDNTCEPQANDVRVRSWAFTAALALLPIVTALAAYYRNSGPESSMWQLRGDQVFYEYQLSRAAEVDGKWWKLPDDRRLGWPYQSEVAKYPHLLEGYDLLLISTFSARLLSPIANYHLMVLSVIAINGWIAGWLTFRLTRSYFWAAAAILLVTVNGNIHGRMMCHLHLFKLGWFLLATWAYWRFLEAPSWRRGAALGLGVALVLQGSFYFGYFVALTYGVWWLGCLVAGRFDRRMIAGTAAALGVFVPLAALITYPALTVPKSYPIADVYAKRTLKDTWIHSAELWQYVMPTNTLWASEYAEGVGVKELGLYGEGANYLGLAMLAAISVYVAARLRGKRLCEAQGFLDLAMGQIALLVVLSLSGGASFFLHPFVPSIRAYGRAGGLAIALGSVAAPLVFHGLASQSRSRWLRGSIALAALGLVVYDGYRLARNVHWGDRVADTTPAWVDWLAKQPPQVKLAAFGPIDNDYWYGMAQQRMHHRHTTLNGCEWELLEGDMRLLGASYFDINREVLKYVASVGYNTLAFSRDYLKKNPWIETTPWLERAANLGDWQIYRMSAGTPRYPLDSLKNILVRQNGRAAPSEVPAKAWITDRLDLPETVVVVRPRRVFLAWTKPDGTRVSDPTLGLYQHVFGPDLPAYTIETPKEAGRYQLDFLDEQGHRLASKPYMVSKTLRTSAQTFGAAPPNICINSLKLTQEQCVQGQIRFTIENTSPYYIQAHPTRKKELGSARSLPTIAPFDRGSALLAAKYHRGAEEVGQLYLVLPHDLPPGGRLEMNLPVHPEDLADSSSSFNVYFCFHDVDSKLATEPIPDQAVYLKLSPQQMATAPARSTTR